MIEFLYNYDGFKLENEALYKKWLEEIAKIHDVEIGELCYVFVNDKKLLDINIEFLNHDTYTDIITFDYCQDYILNGDIFISIDRVKENALLNKVPDNKELNRVIAHGILHLIGFDDKDEEKSKLMREQEDKALCIIEKNL